MLTEEERLALQRIIVTVWQLLQTCVQGYDATHAVKLSSRLIDEIEAIHAMDEERR